MNNLRIESVKVDSLNLDPANARQHNQSNIEAISGSLKLFGQRKPLVITSDNFVVAGNGTLEAAKALGWDDIFIVRIPSDWTHEQIKAYALADNRTAEMAEWNPEILKDQLLELDAVGWDVSDFGFEALQPPSESDWAGALDSFGGEKGTIQQMTFTLHDTQIEELEKALKKSKSLGIFVETGNPNANGNALARIVQTFNGLDL